MKLKISVTVSFLGTYILIILDLKLFFILWKKFRPTYLLFRGVSTEFSDVVKQYAKILKQIEVKLIHIFMFFCVR